MTAALFGLAGSALAQSGDSTVNRSAQVASPGLSRAEVLADLELWQRAGMSHWPHPPAEMDMQFTAEYQAGLARYRQLRGGQAECSRPRPGTRTCPASDRATAWLQP